MFFMIVISLNNNRKHPVFQRSLAAVELLPFFSMSFQQEHLQTLPLSPLIEASWNRATQMKISHIISLNWATLVARPFPISKTNLNLLAHAGI